MLDPKAMLMSIARAGISAALPEACLPRAVNRLFSAQPAGRTLVLGAGKAAAHMAAAFERAYPWPCSGLVVTRHGFSMQTESIEVLEAGHPTPDEAGLAAAERLLDLAASARPGDRVVFLLSGGASALLPAPLNGMTLGDEATLTDALLRSGAAIADVNIVRSALSRIKAGGLARVCPQPIVTLAISDVVGDDPAAIGSGPTWGAEVETDAARRISEQYGITLPSAAAGQALDSLRSSVRAIPDGWQDRYHIVARGGDMCSAAAAHARTLGLEVVLIESDATGEAATVARRHAEIALRPVDQPTLYISGGELTVTMGAAKGRGGPNQEYALALAIAFDGHPNIWAIALDSDGIDGIGDAAGAIVGPNTTKDAAAAGVTPVSSLEKHDSGHLLDIIGSLIKIGPTGTNVNDLRLIYVEHPDRSGTGCEPQTF